MKAIALLAILAVVSCSASEPKEKTVRVDAAPIQRPTLYVPEVDTLNQRPVSWVVVTAANIDQILAEMVAKGQTPTLFALTEQGYKNITLNQTDQLKVILQLQSAVEGYRRYYVEVDGVIYKFNQQIAQTPTSK
jgi:hypothetical protein